MARWPGGLIRKTPVTPAGPYQDGAAPGVWTLAEASYWTKQGLWPVAGNIDPRGLFAAGTNTANITYISIATLGNSVTFGNLSASKSLLAACSSSTRGLFGGGQASGGPLYNTIDYVTIATTGNSTSFGALSQLQSALGSCSSSTRGLFGGGYTGTTLSPVDTAVIGYVTIATTGNSTSFGNLSVTRDSVTACASTTRGLFAGGFILSSLTYSNVIDYVTIATTGNATDFGDLSVTRQTAGSCASSTRGLFAGGDNASGNSNVIDYVTIATTGNATDFGDLTAQTPGCYGCSSSTRAVFYTAAASTLSYVTIATTGNSVAFGSLGAGGSKGAACSAVHGGL